MTMARDAAYFGTGFVGATSTTDGANVKFAALKGISVDFSQELVALQAQYTDPLAFGKGPRSTKIKIESMTIFGGSLALALGGTSGVGSTLFAYAESHTVPEHSSYTVQSTNHATFSVDYGVYDVTAGVFLTYTSGEVSAGLYSISDGTYTFDSSAASHVVQLCYSYTSAATGVTATITNAVMSVAPTYSLVGCSASAGNAAGTLFTTFPTVAFANLGFALKDNAWTTYNVEAQACADVGGTIMTGSTTL
jgi:uncharacterized protein YaiE (UPF0345 family)